MDDQQFREALNELGMTPAGLATGLECDDRLIRRMYAGRVVIPDELALFIDDLVRVWRRRPEPRREWGLREARIGQAA